MVKERHPRVVATKPPPKDSTSSALVFARCKQQGRGIALPKKHERHHTNLKAPDMNLKTNKHHRLAQRPWRLQFTSTAGRWCQPCSWLNENKRVRDQKPKLQRIGGHRPRLLDRRIFQMTLDGRRPYWGMVGVRISRALRKLRVQKCRRIHTRTVARPWFELASPQVIPVEHFPVTPCLEQSALNTWNAVEDIWCRLDVICQAIVSMYDDRVEVEFADAGTNDWDQNSTELIDWAQNPQSYRWREGAQHGDLVQFIEMRGNHLVVSLTSIGQMTRWSEGRDIVCLLRSCLTQIGKSLTDTNSCPASTPQKLMSCNKYGQPK